MKKYNQILCFLSFLCFLNANSQDGDSHEIAIVVGDAAFSTDYGQRNEFSSAGAGNSGIGIGIVHYWNFTDYGYLWDDRTSWFDLHFRLRSELSYMSAKLDHFGEYAETQSLGGEQLRAMHGSTRVINLGTALEYSFKDIVDYGSRFYDIKWSPYVSLGLMANFYKNTLESDLGDYLVDPTVLFPKWQPEETRDIGSGFTGSWTFGLGTRYRIGDNADLELGLRWQFFFSNWVDGLNARVEENKSNDWVYFLNVGYIYYLDDNNN